MSPPLAQVGLIGCGFWGAHILRDLRALGCAVDVVERRGGTIEGARSVTTSVDHLDALDGYIVATPSPTHAEIIRALLPRGRPIFCEKPLTTDKASAAALAREGAGLLFVMHKWAYHGGVQAIAALGRRRELGELRAVFTRRLQWGKPAAAADHVWELAVHDLTIVRELMGFIPPLRAARGLSGAGQLDAVAALLGDGPFVHMEVSAHWPGVERVVRAFFDDGMAMLDDPYADHVAIVRGRAPPGERRDPEIERRSIDTEWPLLKQLRAFVGHLRGGPPPPTDAAQGAEVVSALQDIREAALAAAGRCP